jgi:outer membrane lipoprotein-sorting protein
MKWGRAGLAGLILLAAVAAEAGPVPREAAEAAGIVARMTTAYEKVAGYQTATETSEYRDDRIVATRRFRYSFHKPDRLRIDMETPHPGMRIVYPDEKGQVFVHFGGWMSFMKLRLAPDNSLFATRAGQRLDQSDFGLLIRNIGRSIGEERRGELTVREKDGRVQLEVVATDHFLPEEVTRYCFVIDRTLWLPVAVTESTPEGRLKRTIRFRDLTIVPAFPEDFFRIDEEETAHGQSPG